MKRLNSYITEKLHLRGDNDSLVTAEQELESFIDRFTGHDKVEVIEMCKNCIEELKKYSEEDDHWCYVVKPNIKRAFNYMWSSNPGNKHVRIGDEIDSTTVLFIMKKHHKLPKKYE